MVSRQNQLYISLLASAILPVGLSLYITSLPRDWLFENHIIHSLLEGYGSIAALLIAATVLILQKFDKLSREYIWPASALMGMGVLDGFHAACLPGNLFVWLHSAATFVGGILIASIWMPDRLNNKNAVQFVPEITLVFVVTLGLYSIFVPQAVPQMLDNGEFTTFARIMNLAGAFGFLTAAIFYFKDPEKNPGTMVFINHCLLFGAAGMLFEVSTLWDTNWWLWHFLRATAYSIGLVYFVLLFYRSQKELYNSREELELKVKRSTQDLTETNKRLLRKKMELERSNKDLEQLAYIASHDLKAPLRTIIGFTDLLVTNLNQNKIDEDTRIFVQEIHASTERMQKLVDDLLKYSKISHGSIPFQAVDLSDVMDRVRADIKETLKQEQGTLVVDDLPEIPANESLVYQVFINLTLNSLKFHGESPPLIRISAEECARTFVISVTDNGIGIEPIYHDKIFNMFQRLHTQEEYEGTGIGLAMVKRIMELHNGKISLESKTSEGCKFLLEFPKKQNVHSSEDSLKAAAATNKATKN